MNRSQLINELATKTNLNKRDITTILDALLNGCRKNKGRRPCLHSRFRFIQTTSANKPSGKKPQKRGCDSTHTANDCTFQMCFSLDREDERKINEKKGLISK